MVICSRVKKEKKGGANFRRKIGGVGKKRGKKAPMRTPEEKRKKSTAEGEKGNKGVGAYWLKKDREKD